MTNLKVSLWLLFVFLGATPSVARDYPDQLLLQRLEQGHLGSIEGLLYTGADPNLRDSQGVPILLRVIASGKAGIAFEMVRLGANVEARDPHGRSPLQVAIEAGYLDCTRGLLLTRAGPDRWDSDGRTPLILAIQRNDPRQVRAILAYTPDLTMPDKHGVTALEWAKRTENPEVMALVQRAAGLHPISYLSQCVAAFLGLLSFALPRMWSMTRNDKAAYLSIWLILLVEHVIALLNSYVVYSRFYIEGDAYNYYKYAAVGELGIGSYGGNYVRGLGLIYQVLGPSILLAEEIGILVSALSFLVFLALVRQLGFWTLRVPLVLGFGLLPSRLIYSSLPYKESWQILFLLLVVYWSLRVWERITPRSVVGFTLSCLGLGLWHPALAAMGVIILVSGCVLGCLGCERSRTGLVLIAASSLVAGLLLISVWSSGKLLNFTKVDATTVIPDPRFARVAQRLTRGQAAHHPDGSLKANYAARMDLRSVTSFLSSAPKVLLNYMFAPFPWQYRKPIDLYGMAESWGRAGLLGLACLGLFRVRAPRLLYIFFLYLTMEIIWAAGTLNWGTSVRHHTIGYGLLLLVAAAGVGGITAQTRQTHDPR